jgi:UDP-glucose 4-epimerase
MAMSSVGPGCSPGSTAGILGDRLHATSVREGSRMRILVTDDAGFIGANLARRLVELGDSVVVLDDLSTGNLDNLSGLSLEFVEGSILDEQVLTKAVSRSDSVLHLEAVPSVPRSIKDPMRSS